jgi:DNA invertase Pin-like site-specific DNA recombinase
VAELERGLIVERVKAGLRNAKAKGKQLGRPKKILDTKRIATLRANGVDWKRRDAIFFDVLRGVFGTRQTGPQSMMMLQ